MSFMQKKQINCSCRSQTKKSFHQGRVSLLTHFFHSSRVQAIVSKKNGHQGLVQKEIGVGWTGKALPYPRYFLGWTGHYHTKRFRNPGRRQTDRYLQAQRFPTVGDRRNCSSTAHWFQGKYRRCVRRVAARQLSWGYDTYLALAGRWKSGNIAR